MIKSLSRFLLASVLGDGLKMGASIFIEFYLGGDAFERRKIDGCI